MGISPVIFGVRVRAGEVGAPGVDIDYCAGADQAFSILLLFTIITILETFPVGTSMGEISEGLPTYERRPIDQDPCWPALKALAEERAKGKEPQSGVHDQESVMAIRGKEEVKNQSDKK